MSNPTLLLMDGHSIAYRAFFALPVENFRTTTGQTTNAVYGFTSMLLKVLSDEQPTHVAVAFDVSKVTFRTDHYADYKAGRAETPEEFGGQIDLIKEVLDALRITHIAIENVEADDVIATLATKATAQGFDVLICSGDRDAIQLVNDKVTVIYPLRGVTDTIRLTPQAVEERYLVPPARYPELSALVGEKSDNLPGVPGVGPRTAAKWLAMYDGLDNLLHCADQIKGKVGESLRAHLDDVRRNKRLNELVRDLDLPVTLSQTERQDFDRLAINKVFDALEFRTLKDRVISMLPQEKMAEVGQDLVGEISRPGTLGAWLTRHGSTRLGLEVSGYWRAGAGDVDALAISDVDGNAIWIDVAELTPDDDAALATWLACQACGKVLHEAKTPTHALAARGWVLRGIVCDTELAAYLLNPDQRGYDLADLSIRYLNRELATEQGSGGGQEALDFGDHSSARERMLRARVSVELADSLMNQLAARNELSLLTELELPLQRDLVKMESAGIAVDVDRLNGLYAEFDAAVRKAEQSAYAELGQEINLASPKQLQVILFDKLGMPRTKKTRTGYTTNAEALGLLYEQTQHPFLACLLQHRDQIKLRQTVEGLQRAVADDGRIHTTYLQTVAATGRLSSADPNLQNIPIRTESGRQIREAFVVGKGYESLMTADYSQIEMRIMAHASKDHALIEAFRSGADFHTVTAARVFKIAEKDVTPAQRARIKAMNYGLAYGLGSYGLSQQLKVSRGEAQRLMEEYFAIFGHVKQYLDSIVHQARTTGYTETLLGRRRYLPDLTSSNRQRREMAERAALNAPIQGSAADIIKRAMLKVDQALTQNGLASRVLLQVHDELVLEIAPGEAKTVEAMVRDRMGHAIELDVPLDVSVGTGYSWHEAAH